MDFKGKVLIIGFGSVARCTLPILLKHIDIPCKNITVIDFADKRDDLKSWIEKGVKYFQTRITPGNLAEELSKHVSSGGLIIDLAWNISCDEIVTWCHDNNVLYANTSVEEWDPYRDIDKKDPYKKSLHFRQILLRKMFSKFSRPATTFVVDHGANPGLISHFTKKGLVDIAEKAVKDSDTGKKTQKALEDLLKQGHSDKKYARLAMELGVKVIHCSERDTQITDKPKEVDEFVGTWSIEGLREEGTAPAELGWGTHEKKLPRYAHVPKEGPRNQIFLSQMGMNTWVRSWVPNFDIIGMVIRHAEAFSISNRLTVWKGKKAVYRPTVHYAYMPCDETLVSLYELRAKNYQLQPKLRIMSDEITKGEDILGALIMGHKYNSWWTGSILSIDESRKIVPHQNATTMQVATGMVTAVMWMIENPHRGFCLPDDLPYDYVLKIAKPYLGKLVSQASDWTPLKNYRIFFKENPRSYLDEKNIWCFDNFLFRD